MLRETKELCVLMILLLTAPLAGCGGSPQSAGKAIPFEQQVAQAQQERSPQTRAEKLVQIALEQARAQDLLGAQRTLKLAEQAVREVNQPTIQAELWGRVAQAWVGMNNRYDAGERLDAALRAAEKIEEVNVRARTLARLAAIQAEADSAHSAEQTLGQVEQLAQQVADPLERALVLSEAAASLHSLGNDEQAARVLDTAVDLARSVEDQAMRCRALSEVAAAQKATGNAAAEATFDEAIQSARQIQEQFASALMLCEVVEKLAEVGLTARAHQVLAEAGRIADQIPQVDMQRQVSLRIDGLRRSLPPP